MMEISTFIARAALAVSIVLSVPIDISAGECATAESPAGERHLVVISDLHFGIGKQEDGRWHPTEDFRWSKALDGFLRRISECGNDAVDLVIAGDALELWQPPKEIACKGASADTGCTPTELLSIVNKVVNAHKEDFAVLGAFADRGTNRLFLVPGNHDSALLLDDSWEIVKKAVNAKASRVTRICSGIWASEDGRVVVEHGHQIGEDVNLYSDWPDITRKIDGTTYVERPWGEWFVQSLFNEQETTYRTIDNLGPETAGARFRLSDRGLWGSVKDVARFLKFNLFETAISQKLQVLGADADPRTLPPWDLDVARSWGHLLFARSLLEDDPFRQALMGEGTDSQSLRNELDSLAHDSQRLRDADVRQLCDLVAIQTKGTHRCLKVQLGASAQALLMSKRAVMTEHVRARMRDPALSGMRVFIYAHTHLLEEPWTLKLPSSTEVVVLNTGAFQRVIDEPGFLARAKAKGLSGAEALRQFDVESLPACFTAVVVPMRSGLLEPMTVRWHMEEGGSGEFVAARAEACQ